MPLCGALSFDLIQREEGASDGAHFVVAQDFKIRTFILLPLLGIECNADGADEKMMDA